MNEEKPMTLAKWKAANPEITAYIAPKYKKYRKEFFKANKKIEEADDVKIVDDTVKGVKDIVATATKREALPIPPSVDYAQLDVDVKAHLDEAMSHLDEIAPMCIGVYGGDLIQRKREAAYVSIVEALRTYSLLRGNLASQSEQLEQIAKDELARRDAAPKETDVQASLQKTQAMRKEIFSGKK